MQLPLDRIRDLYRSHYREVYRRCTPELMAGIRRLLDGHYQAIADEFYRTIVAIEGAGQYLTGDLIAGKLRLTMATWIEELFVLRDDADLDRYIERQLEVGHIHARIGLPPHIYNCAVRVVKREIKNRIFHSGVGIHEYRDMATAIDMLADLTASLMNESYFEDVLISERKGQALQALMMGHVLAIKCQTLRAELHAWQSLMLSRVLKSGVIARGEIPSMRQSDLGLWATHKGPLLFQDAAEATLLENRIEELDGRVCDLIAAREAGDEHRFNEALAAFNRSVETVASLLKSLSEHAVAMDAGRDSLTRLFNRRYLDTVMQRDTHYSIRNNRPYVLMMLDIDHFKAINDEYGHEAGDRVLAQVSDLLSESVRAGDFVFRYGGEEFLILLVDVQLDIGSRVAEKIRMQVAGHAFDIGQPEPLKVTCSIGVALHERQPDYNHVITAADQLLFRAKSNGRNRVAVNYPAAA